MNKLELSEFWWSNLSGPQAAIDAVVKALMNGRAPLLELSEDIPWIDTMRTMVEQDFKQDTNLSDVVFEYIDLRFEFCPSPGEFILSRYAPGDHGFRAGSRSTLQKYLTHKGFLRNRVIWLTGIPPEQVREWTTFVKKYETRGTEDGLFILEIGSTREENGKYAQVIDFSDYVHNHDLQIFCSFLMGTKRQYSEQWQEYISTLVAKVCGIDAELAALIIRTNDLRIKTMRVALEDLLARKDFDSLREDQLRLHLERQLESEGFDSLERHVWAAQIQVVFPIIEMERWAFIDRWERSIQNALDHKYISSFGTQITQAGDAELGTLCWMMAQKEEDNRYVLYIQDEDDRAWVRFLHECRNNLAHTTPCTPDQLDTLFSAVEQRLGAT